MRPVPGIHGLVVRRLTLAWVLLTLIVGAAMLYIEMRRIDSLAYGLAVSASESFRAHVTQVGEQHSEFLKAAVAPLLQQGYLQVQVSDMTSQVIAKARTPEQNDLLSGFADRYVESMDQTASGHKVLWLIDGLIVLVHLPLLDQKNQPIGDFYGAYQVDPLTRQRVISDLIRNVSVVLVAILVTALALYPVIIGLNNGVFQLSSKLMHSNIELMEVLGSAIAKRDSDTDLHNYRVCLYSIRFAEACGFSDQDIRIVITGAFLHDVGKIGISDSILLKPAKLTAGEFATMKTHVQIGKDIIAKSAWLEGAREVVEFHHEHFDGTGYLAGLKGDSIPLAARLFAIVDVFDALTSHRPYKVSLPLTDALHLLAEGRSKHFDPELLDVFMGMAVPLHADISQLSEAELRKRLHEQVTDYFFRRSAA